MIHVGRKEEGGAFGSLIPRHESSAEPDVGKSEMEILR